MLSIEEMATPLAPSQPGLTDSVVCSHSFYPLPQERKHSLSGTETALLLSALLPHSPACPEFAGNFGNTGFPSFSAFTKQV